MNDFFEPFIKSRLFIAFQQVPENMIFDTEIHDGKSGIYVLKQSDIPHAKGTPIIVYETSTRW